MKLHLVVKGDESRGAWTASFGCAAGLPETWDSTWTV